MIYILILKDFWFLWDISTSFVKLEKHTVRSDTFCFNALCDFFFFSFFIHCSFYCFFFFFWRFFSADSFIFDPETETYDSMFLDVCSEKRMLFGLASCLSVHNCNFGYTHTCKVKKKIEISGFFEILRLRTLQNQDATGIKMVYNVCPFKF